MIKEKINKFEKILTRDNKLIIDIWERFAQLYYRLIVCLNIYLTGIFYPPRGLWSFPFSRWSWWFL